jgi:hypothetical protein
MAGKSANSKALPIGAEKKGGTFRISVTKVFEAAAKFKAEAKKLSKGENWETIAILMAEASADSEDPRTRALYSAVFDYLSAYEGSIWAFWVDRKWINFPKSKLVPIIERVHVRSRARRK